MSAATAFLEDLQARGVVVSAPAPDRVRMEAPPGVLTDLDRARLRQYKAALLTLLAGHDALPVPICLTCRRRPTTPATGYRCPTCVERARALCAARRPGDAPIILTGDATDKGTQP